MSRFTFKLHLGSEEVKRVAFPNGSGRRELVGSNGQSIGFLKLDEDGLTLSIREGQAVNLAEAQMY